MIALLVAFSSYEKSISECELIPAKVLRSDCDRVIFELLTNEAFGDGNWEDVQTGQHYSNIVSYYSNCKIAKLNKGEKITLYVSLKQPAANLKIQDCSQCDALSQCPPQTEVDFTSISKSYCEVYSSR